MEYLDDVGLNTNGCLWIVLLIVLILCILLCRKFAWFEVVEVSNDKSVVV